MKRLILTTLICLFWSSVFCQIFWQSDLDYAKKISSSTGKLIVIDFWATWCGPCQTMERELWNNEKIKSIADNFIGVKINVDYNPRIASSYSVNAIPTLVIAFFDGEVLWQTTGFSGASEFIEILSSLPANSMELYESINALKQNEKNPDQMLLTGIQFQKSGRNLKNISIRESFLIKAAYLFRKAEKTSQDTYFDQKADLYSILNEVLWNNPKKALKSIGKSEFNTEDKEISQLFHYVKASCFKMLQDEQNYQKEKDLITNENFLAELNR
jgi:thiol-disulfide isomerase/thioredoxin